MKSVDIKGSLRKEVGKKTSKKLRRQGFVPCELYGGKENVHFYAEDKILQKLIYTKEVFLINLDIEGEKHMAILQNAQFHPVSDDILHIDFIEVTEDKKVIIKVPVNLEGNSVGIRNGGKLRQAKRALKVTAFAKDLPDTLDIDITNLDIGDGFKVKDLNYENLDLIDPENALVIGIVSSRISKSMLEDIGEEGEEGAEAVEGEEGAEATEETSEKAEEKN